MLNELGAMLNELGTMIFNADKRNITTLIFDFIRNLYLS
jgi:hypothetical protein